MLLDTGLFEILSDYKMPVVVFTFREPLLINIEEFTKLLREKQWMLPYYKLSGEIDITVMRIVVRNDIKEPFLVQLVDDLVHSYRTLITKDEWS